MLCRLSFSLFLSFRAALISFKLKLQPVRINNVWCAEKKLSERHIYNPVYSPPCPVPVHERHVSQFTHVVIGWWCWVTRV